MFVVRRVVAGEEEQTQQQWYLPLRHVTDSCLLVWHVTLSGGLGSAEVVLLPENRRPSFITVTSLTEWQAKAFKAYSPLGQLVKAKDCHFKTDFTTIVLLVEGECETVLAVAARHAFWQLNATYLRKLAEFQGIALVGCSTLFSVLQAMIFHILETDDEEAVLAILEKRLGNVDASDAGYADILDMDEAAVCLDPNDRDQVKQAQKDHVKESGERKVNLSEWVAKKQAIAKSRPNQPAGKLARARTAFCLPPGKGTKGWSSNHFQTTSLSNSH